MRFTYLVIALAVFSTSSALSEPVATHEVEERGWFPLPTRPVVPTKSSNHLGFATKTWNPSSYGFFTKPSFPTLFPKPPTPSTNVTSTSDDAKKNPYLFNSPQHRGNWSPGFTINTDQTQKWPNTFRTVRADWRVQNMTLAPDGTPQQMLVINGQYPGPLVEANWGDWIEITVHNDLQHNGTGIHWHGFRQFETNTEDGVPGITECPIAPGQGKTYRFQATSYGTSWYHTHFSAQYGAGIVGPVLIHGPASANYDIDLGTIMINDWYPLTVFQEDWFAERLGPPTASNYLINGMNVKPDGSAGKRATFEFQPGKKHLMRFINNGVDNHFKIQLDGHTFTVISTDFVPIVPYSTKELSLNVGQRYDVVVTADQTVSNYYLRALAAPACSRNSNDGTGVANGVVSYKGAPSGLPVANGTVALIDPTCADEPLASLTPIVTIAVDSTGFASEFDTLPVNLNRATLATGENVFLWYLNGISQNIDWSNPTIETVADNRTISTSSNSSQYFPDSENIISLPTPNKWTFWVIQNQFFVPHPMHLHGHDFSILGQGTGTFTPSAHLGQLNFANPARRDVATLVASGWTVMAFKTDNPGSWLFHCHIAWHVGEGLSLQFLELPEQIPALYGGEVNGGDFQESCKAWDRYFGGADDVYGKTDSGLKKREAEPKVEVEMDKGMLRKLGEHLKRHRVWGGRKH